VTTNNTKVNRIPRSAIDVVFGRCRLDLHDLFIHGFTDQIIWCEIENVKQVSQNIAAIFPRLRSSEFHVVWNNGCLSQWWFYSLQSAADE